MILDVICDLPALIEIEPEWLSLANSIRGTTPFQQPVWLLTWWRHFGSGELRVLVFRQDQSIVGILPCFLHEWEGARQVTLIGSGISDYLEPPIRREINGEAMGVLSSYLEARSDWQVCNWQDLSFDTVLKVLPSSKLMIRVVEDTRCSQLCLSGNFAEYWKGRPASLRQNVRRDRAKTEALGALKFEAAQEADPELMSELIRLHCARWQAHGQTGTIAANGSADFLSDVAREFAARDMLRIFSLRLNKQILAVILAFQYSHKISNYLTAFDPRYERFGVGRTLLFEALRYSFENGYSAWDFLRGNEAYKSWWGAQTISKRRVLITRQ